jgi:hypothetical protein
MPEVVALDNQTPHKMEADYLEDAMSTTAWKFTENVNSWSLTIRWRCFPLAKPVRKGPTLKSNCDKCDGVNETRTALVKTTLLPRGEETPRSQQDLG